MQSKFFSELGQGLTHLFYPRLCEGCTRPLLPEETVLCMSCALELPATNQPGMEDNETTLRFAGRVPFLYATSYAYFTSDGLLQHLLHGLKYKDRKENGVYLGRMLGRSIKDRLQQNQLPDVIIPVPLHKKKEAKRGYNQSMLIANGMSEILNIPAQDDLLIRTRNTESQTNKNRAERVSNMEDAFGISDAEKLTGKHVLLCDDVLTTGATLEACARALLADKSIKISFATVGIAVS